MRKHFRPLLRSKDGVTIVEFAFALPIVMTVAIGGLECANLALAHLRVSQIAQTTADTAARILTQVDETDIEEVFAGAQMTGASINLQTNGRVVLSSLESNGLTGGNAGQKITWQRCYGALNVAPSYGRQGAGATNSSLSTGMGETGRQITAAANTAVMFVEVTYAYQPLIGGNFLGIDQIRYETAFTVRERSEFGITNVQNRTVRTCP